ncbi:hypothetical protein B0I35DRAFT_362380 [Stachybotrys elegans]|uniref:Carrier domain-containing protein n=1 Tax=Stachybotrys elegans TaxID=80388 RepID=A0A8K0SEB5_9HYPO|nr:hypothetical protein B0I35DRAFT_362380 [Stachybotrys elegans]
MSTTVPIAVIGLGCRFPGDSSNPEALWDVIAKGKSCYSKVPKERFNMDAFRHPSHKMGTAAPEGAHFLTQNVAEFDAPFFGISPSDAKAMDPQQRLLLEVVYESLENAGLPMESLAGSNTSCHVGCFTRDWSDLMMRDPEAAPSYVPTGIGAAMLSNRVSWFFDWHGPSMTLDTACSSSLVALDLACQALWSGNANVAVAAGTNLLLTPDFFMWLSNMNFLSKHGKSKAFDIDANGYGRGEGFGAVILKPLSAAIEDGDCIRAVIRGIGTNQDGHTSGITLPSAEAQASLINSVYRKAGLDFLETTYLEAHGTGTGAGDGTEMRAIGMTLSRNRPQNEELYVGSIKANIGHTEGAAGLAGFIKTVLMLEKGVIPAHANLTTLSPKIPFKQLGLRVPLETTPWRSPIRRASVNCFGYGGTNAHVVVEDAASYLKSAGLKGHHNTVGLDSGPTHSASTGSSDSGVLVAPSSPTSSFATMSSLSYAWKPRPRLFVFSAHEESALLALREKYASYLRSATETSATDPHFLDRIAFSLFKRRSVLPWKGYAVASSFDTAPDEFESRVAVPVRSTGAPRIGFVFTGQGAQWAGMGKELISHPVFEQSVTAANDYLQTKLDCKWSVWDELNRDASSSQLHLAKYSQPICTILQIALIELLRSWGVEPVAVVGHSSGEIAASVCAGALSREHGWKVAYWRGKLSSEMSTQFPNLKGSMLAAGTSEDKAQAYVQGLKSGKAEIACINSPESVTISGDEPAICEVEEKLKADGLFARKLTVENAYHSYHMTHIADAYLSEITDCTPNSSGQTGITMLSSVTGQPLNLAEYGPKYWVDNLTSPVQFNGALAALLKGNGKRRRKGHSTVDLLLEVGPHSALQGPIKQILGAEGWKAVSYVSVLKRGKDAVAASLGAAGSLFASGVKIDINAVNQTDSWRSCSLLTDLPTYSWNHSKTYWSDNRLAKAHLFRAHNRQDLLGAPTEDNMRGDPAWRHFLRTSELPWIRDHKIQSSILYPAAGMICMVIEAARQQAHPDQQIDFVELRDVRLGRPMIVNDDDAGLETKVQFLSSRTNALLEDWLEFRISSGSNAEELEMNCCGFVALRYKPMAPTRNSTQEREFAIQRFEDTLLKKQVQCTQQVGQEEFYSQTTALGLNYGPAFRNLNDIHCGGSSARGVVRVHDTAALTPSQYQDPHLLHPTTLDCMFQLLFSAMRSCNGSLEMAAIPFFIENLKVSGDCPSQPGEKLPGFATAASLGLIEYAADISFGSENGQGPKVEITGIRCRRIGDDSSSSSPVVVQERYGQMLSAPDLSLASSRGLSNYLASVPVDSLAEVLRLIVHKEPSASFMELHDNGPCVTFEALNMMSESRQHQMRLTTWTIASLDTNVAVQLEAHNQKSDVKVAVDTSEDDSAYDDSKFDAVIIREGNEERSIQRGMALLKDSGFLLFLARNNSSARIVKDMCSSAGFDNLVSVAVAGQGNLFVVSRTNIHPLIETGSSLHLILPDSPSDRCLALADKVASNLAEHGLEVTRTQLQQLSIDNVANSSCVSLLELDNPLNLIDNPELFSIVKSLQLQTKRLFWVAGSGDPHFKITQGLFRTVRNEDRSLDITYMELSTTSSDELELNSSLIATTFLSESEDKELSVRNGLCQVSRYATDDALNYYVSRQQEKSGSQMFPIGNSTASLKLAIRQPGLLDSMWFVIDPTFAAPLGKNEVEMENRAIGVNFRDVMTLMGQLSDPLLGVECSGIVRRVGSGVSRFKPGDRIYTSSTSCFRTIHRAPEALCQLMPEDLNFTDAATIPIIFITALYCLRDLARLQPGETILIHSAAGGVGQAAIQLAKHYGANIFVTVGSAAKSKIMQDVYGIPKDHIFNSRDTSFVQGIQRVTSGKGVDVVLNSLSGEMLRQTWNCIAPWGRFVEIGIKDIDDNSALEMRPLKRNASFAFFNLRVMLDDYIEKAGGLFGQVAELVAQGVIKPVHTPTPFPVTDILSAIRMIQSGAHIGKVVITMSPTDMVSVHPTIANSVRLKADSTYVLVGGLGGLGRSMALHMADIGAKNLLILSRSGPLDPKAAPLGRELRLRGARAIFHACDVSNASQLKAILDVAAEEVPPISGVIQTAMVLRDGTFENMTHKDFQESAKPKVNGTWNLHQLLPRDLDFFIMLSSISGVTGNPGQANYAAGNTFMDDLASYRRSLGLTATSLDLGLMLDVGFVAERDGTSNLKKWESVGLTNKEFLHILSSAMRGYLPSSAPGGQPSVMASQVVTGLATGGHVAANSLDKPFYFSDARFKELVRAELSDSDAQASGDSVKAFRASLQSATTLAMAIETIGEAIRRRLADVMNLDPENIELSRPVHAYGVDSLVAVELRNWIIQEMQSSISLFELLQSPSLASLAAKVAATCKLLPLGIE